MHIVADAKDAESKKSEMEASAEKLGKEYGKKPHMEVVSGSIFNAIGDTAKELKAEMIIMGTHGMKGAQKLFGSKALKVVVSSRIPFFIVQDKPAKDKMETILLPIDFKRENKEKANWIYYLARNFGAKFIILKSKARDKGFRKKILSNIKYIESFLKGHDVAYEIVTSEGKQSFKKEIIEFAKEHEADLILVMATRDIKWVDYLLGAPEQYLIANPEGLPVMCMNPKPAKIAGGFRAAGRCIIASFFIISGPFTWPFFLIWKSFLPQITSTNWKRLGTSGISTRSMGLKDLDIDEEIPEDHETLEENASQKAWYIYKRTGRIVLQMIPVWRLMPWREPRVSIRPGIQDGHPVFPEMEPAAGNIRKLAP